jgi:lysophospholipase L1-like esterase
MLIVLSAGNVGAATYFPSFIRPFYTKLNLSYHKVFGKIVAEAGGVYVNLYEPSERDPFTQEPERYLSADGLHPSGEGYDLWFQKVEATLRK